MTVTVDPIYAEIFRTNAERSRQEAAKHGPKQLAKGVDPRQVAWEVDELHKVARYWDKRAAGAPNDTPIE